MFVSVCSVNHTFVSKVNKTKLAKKGSGESPDALRFSIISGLYPGESVIKSLSDSFELDLFSQSCHLDYHLHLDYHHHLIVAIVFVINSIN